MTGTEVGFLVEMSVLIREGIISRRETKTLVEV